MLRAFWRKAYEDGLTGLASMVAYNLMLAIFPLALLALFVAGRILRSPEVADSVTSEVTSMSNEHSRTWEPLGSVIMVLP